MNVSNLADSAYEAQLFIVHQKSVSYIATKKPVSSFRNLKIVSVIDLTLRSLADECNLQQLQRDFGGLQLG